MFDIFWRELNDSLPDITEFAHFTIRLLAAIILGSIIGIQREFVGKSAGVRTHILVALGATLFVVAAIGNGMSPDGVSRVVQGLATGIGFIGAGAILKLSATEEIRGLTTAAGIWMTAAIGVTVGLGNLSLAVLATIMSWIVLASIGLYEGRNEKLKHQKTIKNRIQPWPRNPRQAAGR